MSSTPFCTDCPDHEGCMQGIPCDVVKRVQANYEQHQERDAQRRELVELRRRIARLERGSPIEPKDIRLFQRIESRGEGPFADSEVIRRGVVTRIYETRSGSFIFYAGRDSLGGPSYRKTPTTYVLLEEAPEDPFPREEPE